MKLATRLALAGITLMIGACSGQIEDTLPGQPIMHRQEAFKAILRAFEPFGDIIKQRAPDADTVKEQARALIEVRDVPWQYFTDDSDQPPSKSTSALWQNRADFDAKRIAFIEATDALTAAAEADNTEVLKSAVSTVEQSCKSCHKAYRR